MPPSGPPRASASQVRLRANRLPAVRQSIIRSTPSRPVRRRLARPRRSTQRRSPRRQNDLGPKTRSPRRSKGPNPGRTKSPVRCAKPWVTFPSRRQAKRFAARTPSAWCRSSSPRGSKRRPSRRPHRRNPACPRSCLACSSCFSLGRIWRLVFLQPAGTDELTKGPSATGADDADPAATEREDPKQPTDRAAVPSPPIQPVAEKPLTLAEERDAVLDQMEKDCAEQGAQPAAPLLPAGDRANGGRLRRPEAGENVSRPVAAGEARIGFLSRRPLDRRSPGSNWQRAKKTGAGKTLDDALAAAANLPTVGRYSVDSAAWLAAALVAGRPRQRGIGSRRTFSRQRIRPAAWWRR